MPRPHLPVPIPAAICAAVALALAPPARCQTFTWSAGDYAAALLPDPIASTMVVHAVAGGSKSLNKALTNNGTIDWDTTDALTLTGNGVAALRNEGLFLQRTDGRILYNGGAPSTFDNAGTLRKSGGSGDLLLDVAIANRAGGVLDAASGRIVYRTSSSFDAGSVFKGAGTHVFVTSGVTPGIYSFGGTFSGENNLLFAAGTYDATALTKPQTDATWTGGGFAGQWNIDRGRTLSVAAGGAKSMVGSFTNSGTVAWNTTDALTVAGNGTTTLRNDGLFLQQTDGRILYNGGAPSTFDNNGTLRKSGGSGDLFLDVAVTNRAGGVLDARSGRIVYRSSSSFDAGTVFQGAGTHVFMTSGVTPGIYAFGGDFRGENNLLFAAGTYNATAPTRPQTDATWVGGGFTGTWAVESGRTLTATAGGAKTIEGSFTNSGTVAWTTTDGLTIAGNGATALRNDGLFLQQTDGRIAYTGGAPSTFTNTGILRKTGGSSDLRIGVDLVNTGAVESLSGNIVLPADWRNDGVLRGTAAFQTNRLTNAGTIAPGMPAGPAIVATLKLTGALVESPLGSLSFDVGAGGISDVLNVTGTVGFDGTIRVTPFGSYVPQIGDTFRVMTFAGYSGGVRDVEEFGFIGDVRFTAVYSPTFLELQVTAVPVPEPGSGALLAAGLLSIAALARRRLDRLQ